MFRSLSFLVPHNSFNLRVIILISIIILAVLGVVSLPPISQGIPYHHFADRRVILTIANGNNVLSNILFCIAGILGFRRISLFSSSPTVLRWQFFFASITFAGLGSAYYHWIPSNDNLFLDRLPMTLGFAALTVSLFAERLGERIAKVLLGPFIFLTTASIIYWWFTERLGLGDLRPYLLTQYLPLLLIILLLILFSKGARWDRPYWILLIGCIIGKGFEWMDMTCYEWTYHIISGHTMKHLVTALAILVFRPYTADLTLKKDTLQEEY